MDHTRRSGSGETIRAALPGWWQTRPPSTESKRLHDWLNNQHRRPKNGGRRLCSLKTTRGMLRRRASGRCLTYRQPSIVNVWRCLHNRPNSSAGALDCLRASLAQRREDAVHRAGLRVCFLTRKVSAGGAGRLLRRRKRATSSGHLNLAPHRAGHFVCGPRGVCLNLAGIHAK